MEILDSGDLNYPTNHTPKTSIIYHASDLLVVTLTDHEFFQNRLLHGKPIGRPAPMNHTITKQICIISFGMIIAEINLSHHCYKT